MKPHFYALPAGALLLCAVACDRATEQPSPQPSSAIQEPARLPDPRSDARLTIRFRKGEDNYHWPLHDALLIFAGFGEAPNTILGVKGSFNNEQIIAALKRFYREWRAPTGHPAMPPPNIIFALQNWGSGVGLNEPLQSLSREFAFDVYQYYPVVTHLALDPSHPKPNDKRLGEILHEK